jgi:hypothetical protein
MIIEAFYMRVQCSNGCTVSMIIEAFYMRVQCSNDCTVSMIVEAFLLAFGAPTIALLA